MKLIAAASSAIALLCVTNPAVADEPVVERGLLLADNLTLEGEVFVTGVYRRFWSRNAVPMPGQTGVREAEADWNAWSPGLGARVRLFDAEIALTWAVGALSFGPTDFGALGLDLAWDVWEWTPGYSVQVRAAYDKQSIDRPAEVGGDPRSSYDLFNMNAGAAVRFDEERLAGAAPGEGRGSFKQLWLGLVIGRFGQSVETVDVNEHLEVRGAWPSILAGQDWFVRDDDSEYGFGLMQWFAGGPPLDTSIGETHTVGNMFVEGRARAWASWLPWSFVVLSASAHLHVYYGRTRLDEPEEALTIREVRLLGLATATLRY